MSVLRRPLVGGGARTPRSRWFAAALTAAALVGGCHEPFQPFLETTEGPFSMFGYLDVGADTQWIRVMPVRQNLLTDPAPVDAVVTLEDVESGQTVTLRDSVFEFPDVDLGGAVYAHNFWTAQRIERGMTYRLRAIRSDGATTSALVEMPADAEVVVSYAQGPPDVIRGDTVWYRKPLRIYVQGAYRLYSDAIYAVRDLVGKPPRDSIVVAQTPIRTDPGRYEFRHPDSLRDFDIRDLRRVEMRIGVAPADWPYQPGLTSAEAILPVGAASNVENGFGFVGGVATWAIPLSRCNPTEARPDGLPVCDHIVDASSAAIEGRVVGRCSRLSRLPTIHLTERFLGGGTAVFEWEADWLGNYAFDGLAPGADLLLEVEGAEPEMHLPPLAPGERYVVPDVSVPIACPPGVASNPL